MADARQRKAEVGRRQCLKTPPYQGVPYQGKMSSSLRSSGHEEPTSVEDTSNNCTSDGADSGLGSATMLSGNQEILEYMADHLMHFMSPTLVLPHLMNHDLLTEEDAAYISSPQQTDEERKQRILCALVVQEGDVVERLVECLAGDSAYSNHRYIARKLREAVERKRQHPDLPLSTLRLGTPPRDSKEQSPPAAPIKPRGAAQRNSIAKLLATKRNNVANLISQIETKEGTHQAVHMQQPTRTRSSHDHEPEHDRTALDGSSPSHKMQDVQHEMQGHYHLFHDPSTSVSASRLYKNGRPSQTHPSMPPTSKSHLTPSPPVPHIHNYEPCHEPPSPLMASPTPSTAHFSPPHTHQTPLTSTNPPLPLPLPHPLSTPRSPHPTISSPPPHSHIHTPSTHTFNSLTHAMPHHSHKQLSADSTSPVSLMPSQRALSPPQRLPSLSWDSEEDAHGTRCRPVNEVVLQHGSGTPTSPSSQRNTTNRRESLNERERTSILTSDAGSGTSTERNALPDLLSSSSPKKSCDVTSTYTEKFTEEIVSSEECSPNDESFQIDDVVPVRHRQRTTRLAGLTARFYKHRRSASMSAYDTRPFKRGEQIYASDSRGRMERSGFHYHNHGNQDPTTTKIRASVREGTEKLVKRRIDWLQERVQFNDCPEHIQFTSKTHYGEERELLYSGTLHKHGKPRFVILFTDYLVVLKGRKPSVPSKLGGVFSFQQSSRIDWFSDLEYTARKPLPLHLLTVQHQSSKQSNDNFCLHFNENNKVMEIVLQAVSKEARDIWVEELSEAITQATSAHADTFVLVGNKALLKSSGEPYRRLQLQIHSASSLGLAANCNSFSIFCVIELGKQRCRTPSVMGGYNPSWEYKCEFTDFDDDDNLLIEIFSENIFRPNDFLGYLNVPLTSLPEEQPGRKKFDGNMVLAGLEEAFAGELHITVEQGWETKM